MVDKAAGVCVDSAKVHGIDHIGRQYSLRDQAFLPLTPQGRPILVQASSSAPEITSAANTRRQSSQRRAPSRRGPPSFPTPSRGPSHNGHNPSTGWSYPGS